ncbi:MAG: hypothetical protein MJ128_06100 [Mogibacterium sp.]|nr:hypothetical protein [Mogibacterium sp.]
MYDGEKVVLDSVTELFLTDKHAFSQGINLLIRNNDRKIEFLSEALDKDVRIVETTFLLLFHRDLLKILSSIRIKISGMSL